MKLNCFSIKIFKFPFAALARKRLRKGIEKVGV